MGKRPVKVVHTFKAGGFVRIMHGPLYGMEGYVKREGAKATICLNVEILGSAVEVAISPEDVELVSDKTPSVNRQKERV